MLVELTEDRTVGPFLRGNLALHRIDLHTPLRRWLDCVYALWVQSPEVLKKARKIIDEHAVMVAPDRETWGATPEQIALMPDFSLVEE